MILDTKIYINKISMNPYTNNSIYLDVKLLKEDR